MNDSLCKGHEKGKVDALHNWSSELFAVYVAVREYVVGMDRYGVGLFGIVNSAARVVAYTKIEDWLRNWVPRRAKAKQSYPKVVGNTVEGDLTSRERPIDCVIQESTEEASLPK